MYDCAIIGTGPAGLSAAINLRLHNKSFILFGSEMMSDKVRISETIANYPGFPLISGEELSSLFEKHRVEMGITITDKMVNQIMATKKGYMLLADNDVYEAKTLILAIGVVAPRELPGERDLLGKGVSYCATCDGFLYKGKTIGVVCTSARFKHEITYLSELAGKVYLFPSYKDLTVSAENIDVIEQKIISVNGNGRIESVTLADGREINLSGLFCMRDSIVPTTLLPNIAVEGGQITVDRNMATNLSGCFACGDCTGAPYQIAKAVGEGNVAAHSVIKYLADTAEI